MATKKTTTTPKSTAPKRSSTKAAVTKPVAAAKAVVSAPATQGATDEMSKKELLERLVTESGMKKGDARRALEATLSVLASAIGTHDSISAAPLGKLKIVRKKDTPNGELVVMRLKLKKADAVDAAD